MIKGVMNVPDLKINLGSVSKRLLSFWWIPIVAILILFAVKSRSGSLSTTNLVGPDDYYFLRFAEVIDETGEVPIWDPLGFYPPGRRIDRPWFAYNIVLWGKLRSLFTETTILDATKTIFLPMTVLSGICAFLLGKDLKNTWSGLFLCVLILFNFEMATKMMGNMSDTGIWEMFGTIMCMYLFFRVVKKKTIASGVIFGIGISLFMLMWKGYWLSFWITVPIIGLYFVIFTLQKFLVTKKETIRSKKSKKVKVERISIKESISLGFQHIKPLLIAWAISLGILMIFSFLNFGALVPELRPGYNSSVWDVFTRPYVQYKYFAVKETGGLPNVNVSVSELRSVDIKNIIKEQRVFFSLVSVSLLYILYNIFKKRDVANNILILSFILSWLVVTFLASRLAIRFVFFLLFPLAVGTSYFFGIIAEKAKGISDVRFRKFALSIVVVCLLYFAMTSYKEISDQSIRMGSVVSGNFYTGLEWIRDNAMPNSIVASWWDPGHYVTQVTGMRSIADGAHCLDCDPYPHGQRLIDMGYCLAGSDEDECVDRLQKYRGDSPEFYWIDSSDLIYKYGWFSYFGGWEGDKPGEALNYFTGSLDEQSSNEAMLVYRFQGIPQTLVINFNETQIIPILFDPESGGSMIIRYMAVPIEGGLSVSGMENWDTDSMVFITGDKRIAMFMPDSVSRSLFTNRFFLGGSNILGEASKYFELVYQNPEMKIWKINFPEENE